MIDWNTFQVNHFKVIADPPQLPAEEWERMLRVFDDAGGAYVLYCADTMGLGRVPVLWSDGREDPSGVLRIGKADVIRSRSSKLCSAILTGSGGSTPVANAFADPEVRVRYLVDQLWVAAI